MKTPAYGNSNVRPVARDSVVKLRAPEPDKTLVVYYDSAGRNALEMKVPSGMSPDMLADITVFLYEKGREYESDARRRRFRLSGT